MHAGQHMHVCVANTVEPVAITIGAPPASPATGHRSLSGEQHCAKLLTSLPFKVHPPQRMHPGSAPLAGLAAALHHQQFAAMGTAH